MAWKSALVDRIRAKLFDGKIGHESKSFYTNDYGTLDFTSDDDIPNVRAVKAWIGSGGGGTGVFIPVPFTNQTGITVNWQTDVPPGETETYVALMGNEIPNPTVDSIPDSGSPNSFLRIPASMSFTTDGDGTLLTLTLDWSVSQSGIITF